MKKQNLKGLNALRQQSSENWKARIDNGQTIGNKQSMAV